jgi:hypothetical protein
MTAFLETKVITHDLSLPYAHERNSLSEYINHTIVMIDRSLTLDCTDIIPQALWAETCYTAVYIKNHLPYSAFKYKNCYMK